mgnify:CR=1 FL=1
MKYTVDDLVAFEKEVAEHFNAGRIRAPVHLSGGNEQQLLGIFEEIPADSWIFGTYRSHYHALLHGVPREQVMAEIIAGRSMYWNSPKHRFFTSALVGGILPIAVGVAAGIKRRGGSERVWCFIGDMAATTGIFHESVQYADGHDLPIQFVVEDNGWSTDTPTVEAWGTTPPRLRSRRYRYTRVWPHVNSGKFVAF